MSHNVELKGTKITDLDALSQAVNELSQEGAGCRLDLTAKTFRTYSGQDNRCDAAILMSDGSHDIGLIKQNDGSYAVRYDPYSFSRRLMAGAQDENFQAETEGHHVSYDQEGAQARIGKLIQRYGVCKVERESAGSGNSFERSVNEKTGVVQLLINVN